MASPQSTCRILRSDSAGVRLGDVVTQLTSWGNDREVLIVGASAESAQEIVRVAAIECGAVFGWRWVTLRMIARELCASFLASSGLSVASSKSSRAVTARVLHAMKESGSLGRWAAIETAPGLHLAVAQTISDLRGELATDLKQVEDSTLAQALSSYEEQMESLRLLDRTDLTIRAIEAIEREETSHPYLSKPTAIVDVEITDSLDARLIAALIRRAEDTLITVPQGDDRGVQLLQRELDVTIEDRSDRDAKDAIHNLRTHLFAETAPDQSVADSSLTIFSAPGESRECVEMARQIHKLANRNVPFDRIAVLLRTPSVYRSHIEEAFRRARIPAYFFAGTRRPDPSGRAFLALLRCGLQNYSAERFAEYISIGQMPRVEEAGSPPAALPRHELWVPSEDEALEGAVVERLPEIWRSEGGEPASENLKNGGIRVPRRWEKLLVEAAVIGGIDRWERRLDGLANQLALQARGREEPDGRESTRIARDQRELENLRSFALPLLRDLADLPHPSTWEEWLESLSSLATRALRYPERVLSMLASLAPMGPVGPVDLAEVIRVLEPSLQDLFERPPRGRYGSVFVAPIEMVRGLNFEIVFVPGLAERLFPPRLLEDPILRDDAREKLNDSVGCALPVELDRIGAERLALRFVAGAATSRLFLSYPRLDLINSRPRVPSFYALEAARAAEGKLPSHSELAQRADRETRIRVGWPAPESPDEAIDEAEFDLATLKTLLTGERREARGAARYLLNANPHLGRALRFRAMRWRAKWSQSDGLYAPVPEAIRTLERYRLGSRTYSATSLQNFAICPYKFFLASIQGLEPREVIHQVEELNPLQKGALVHEIQFRLLSRLREESFLPIDPANLAKVSAVLDEVVATTSAEHEDRLNPAIPKVWEDGIESIRRDLREWLYRASHSSDPFVPWRFELAFGLPEDLEQDPDSSPDPVVLDEGVRVRGKIDLVERGPNSELRVTDHKTGKARFSATAIIDGGETLQPVLYGLVAEKLFPECEVRSGRLYYCTTMGGFQEREVFVSDRARGAMSTVASIIDAAIEAGCLPAHPKERACGWCDFLPVCGPREEARVARKPRLEPLAELRAQH